MRNALGEKGQRNAPLQDQLRRTQASAKNVHVRELWSLPRELSPEADVIERLMILATSIAVDSQKESLLHGFVALLKALIETVEGDLLASFGATNYPLNFVSAMAKDGKTVPILTPRQREVLHLRSMGLGVVTIAERLNLTPRTVHTHIRDAVERLGITGGSMAAVAEARSLGLI